jgi:hypothetical protein
MGQDFCRNIDKMEDTGLVSIQDALTNDKLLTTLILSVIESDVPPNATYTASDVVLATRGVFAMLD